MTSWIWLKLLENIFRDTDFQNFYSIGSDKVVISWFLTSEILLNYVKIKQFLMTSFPVENDCQSKYPSVWLKILSWIITCTNQICFIYFLFGSGITGLRPCFQFSKWKKSTKTDPNWTTKSWFILNRLRRIRWASQFFHTEKSEDPQN